MATAKKPVVTATAAPAKKAAPAKVAAAEKPVVKKAAAKPAVKASEPVKTTRVSTKAGVVPKVPAIPAGKEVEAPVAARKPNPAFMKAMTPSAILAAVIGATPLPRTEVTKKIWEYIKKLNLQDAANRQMINADEKLKEVFGGKMQVSMFEMTKFISGHLK